MGAIAAPILPGKLDTWKKWAEELKGPRSEEFRDHNSRLGLTRHRAWLQETPDGGHLVIVVHDGPGADEFVAKLGQSDHPFDVWFRERVEEAHGLDLSEPPEGPPAELWIDGSG
ncbi:MAG: hypothetical protein ACE5KX_00760 [Acidimicrobiia bacterium]